MSRTLGLSSKNLKSGREDTVCECICLFQEKVQSVPEQGETATALQDFKGRRNFRHLADAVAMGLAAGEASEMHPERGTGFASAAVKWGEVFTREGMKKNPEGMEKHAQAPLMRSLCPEHRTHKGSRGQ